MSKNSRDIASVWDMTQAIRNIQTFTANISYESYVENLLIKSAVERQFIILGEAARRISEEFRQAHSAIDWRRAVGLRNIVTHRYEAVDQEILWTIITTELDDLLMQLEPLLPPLPDDR